MSAVLVTGGMGFVGQRVVRRLRDRGDTVVAYNRDFSMSDDPHVITVQGELFDLPRLTRAITEHQVDRIIHTAAQSHPGVSIELPVTTFAANVDGTLSVFEAARMTSTIRRIINFSSECVYGNHEGTITEDTTPRPTTPYGVTKVATELLGNVYTELYGQDVISLRISEVYGPGNRMPEVLKEMLQAVIRGVRFDMPHGASQRFQFVHVDDVADAVLRALDANHDVQRRILNITGGEQVSLAEAADKVRELFPAADIRLGAGPVPQWDQQGAFSIKAALDEIGYAPTVDFAAGLSDYAAWLADNDY